MLTIKNDYTKPYDSSEMKYTFNVHKYSLELDHTMFATGINLSTVWLSNDNALLYLEQVRDVVYTYILRYKDSKYYSRMIYYLSHSKSAREGILQIMLDAITYNYEDGGFKIAYQTGINLHEMKDIDIKIEMAVSVVAEQIMHNFGMKQRVNNMNMNTFEKYETLDELKQYLIDESLETEENLEDVDDIKDIPISYKYRTFINSKGQFVYEDLISFEKEMETFGVDW